MPRRDLLRFHRYFCSAIWRALTAGQKRRRSPIARVGSAARYTRLTMVAALVSGAPTTADVLAVESLAALPVCRATYAQPEPTLGGGTAMGPAGALYCVMDEDVIEKEQSRILGRLSDRISRFRTEAPDLIELRLSAAYFKTDYVARWLCQRGFDRSLPVTIYVQRAQGELIHLDQSFRDRLDSCFDRVSYVEIGCDVWDQTTGPACPHNQTNTHHVKAIWLHAGTRSLHVFGTGNFSPQSMVANIEDWLAIETGTEPEDRSVLSCVWPFLDALASQPALTYNEQRAVWSGCATKATPAPGIDLVVLPFARKAFRDRLRTLFAASTRISLVAEVLESDYLIDLIKSAPGDATLYLDDAYYYTAMDPTGATFAHVDPANAKLIHALDALAHVSIRYLQTNHHEETNTHNSVHARVILFETPTGAVSMNGSTQFKDGSWRLNTEQQVFLSAPYSEMHLDYFRELEKRSVTEDQLPKNNTRAFPE